MNFNTLVNLVGYWAAIRMALTFIGVDFVSSNKEGDSSLCIKAGGSHFVLWHNDAGCGELHVGLRYQSDLDCEDMRIARGIDNTFDLLGEIRQMVEGDLVFDQIIDSYSKSG